MRSDSISVEESPSLRAVLEALDNDDCRTILRKTAEPITANEIIRMCDISRSSVYRKLEILSQASLVKKQDTIRPDGGRLTRYKRDFEDVTISISEDDGFSVTIKRSSQGKDGLEEFWLKTEEGLLSD
jgi:DNA-binding transcriptional ArsR family regulator